MAPDDKNRAHRTVLVDYRGPVNHPVIREKMKKRKILSDYSTTIPNFGHPNIFNQFIYITYIIF